VLELLRPPPHRGPLIAAGAVVLATGLALAELRISSELTPGYHLAILAAAAGVILALGYQAPNEDGRPPAYQSVLLVTGLLLLYGALLRLADALGSDFSGDFPAGMFTWTGIAECGAALYVALRRRSAICLLIASIAGAVALLAAWEWVFEPGTFTASRWLLGLVAAGLVLVSLTRRERSPRQAELLVDGAGLAVLAIGLQAVVSGLVGSLGLFGTPPDELLPGFWELILFGTGCGLVAFGALDRSPGPAWLGVATLATFVAAAGLVGDDTLEWWPLSLIAIGTGAMIAGLRPRRPLPPEPDAYRAGDAPLASRTADDELVLRVRVDDAPPR
jgi:hypothetical protein